jgi:hypothetical protein
MLIKKESRVPSPHDDFWYRKLFKIRLYEASGNAFQQLFSALMQYSVPGFQSVAPWGNWGDGGNDGWCPLENRYFQVYGPDATTAPNPVSAVKKAVADFDKLKAKWASIECYHFVYNDRFVGMPAPIGSILQELKMKERLIEATPISSADLEARFMSLNESDKMTIVGGIPSATPDYIDPKAISELLTHLADNPGSRFALLDVTSPDFDTKIVMNGITSPVSDQLRISSYQVDDVNRFLNARDIGLAQQIAAEVKELYTRSQTVIPDSVDAPNERYVWLVESLIPEFMRKHPHSQAAYRQAAQVIIAKYFETCDAYEHPNSINPA